MENCGAWIVKRISAWLFYGVCRSFGCFSILFFIIYFVGGWMGYVAFVGVLVLIGCLAFKLNFLIISCGSCLHTCRRQANERLHEGVETSRAGAQVDEELGMSRLS